MSIQQNQIVQPTYNGQDIYYRTPVDAIVTDGMSLDDYIRNTTGVVESGSNANGNYVKFADGTMICQGSKTFTSVACTTGYGGLYRSSAGNQMNDFPVEFYDIPIVNFGVTEGSASGNNSNTGPIVLVFMKTNTDTTNVYVPTKTNPGRVSIVVGSSQTISTITISYTAIGRWKDYDVSVLPSDDTKAIINTPITNYSNNEQVIGLWTDGKPLYRKTYNLGNLPNNATKNIASGLPYQGISIKNTYGNCRRASDGYQPPINHVRLNNETAQISGFMGSNGNIEITTGTDRSGMTSEITFEYTKDSDQPITSQTKDLLTVVNGKNITDLETIIQQRVDQVIADRLSLNDAYWVGWARSNVSLSAGISLWTNMTTEKSKNITYSSNVLTVNKSGLYFFKAFTHWQGVPAGSRQFFEATISGGSPSTKTNIRSEDDEYHTGDPVVTCTEALYLQAGAKITMSVYTSGAATFKGSATNNVDASGVYIYKIGDYIDI